MRLLVFGNSDTRGAVVSGQTWPGLVRDGLAEARTEPVELVDRPFVPVGRRAPGLAEQIALESDAEIALIPLGEYAFWAETVELRVRRLLGRRAARWFRATERKFDSATVAKGGSRAHAHRLVKRAAHRIIGTQALASVGEVTETYREVLSRLARIEHLQVVVVAYPMTPMMASRPARVREARERFLVEVRRAAEAHRFRWVDGDALIARAGLTSAEAFAADQVHIGQECHEIFAREITGQVGSVAGRHGA